MKRDDLFLTDSRLVVINDFPTDGTYNISDFESDELIEIKRKVDWLNGLC